MKKKPSFEATQSKAEQKRNKNGNILLMDCPKTDNSTKH